MAEFDLAALMKDVSVSDTGKDRLQYVPFGNIKPDPNNGYSMTGLEELARSIEIVGLQQPIRVRRLMETGNADAPGNDGDGGRQSAVPTGETYVILSGHRRHAAIGLLIERGSKQFDGGVPCVVDGGASSPAMQELKLLLANADNRKMTSADEAQQAERISDCIRKLEDEGYAFPGRHRDWVSKLSGMSRTKLARLDAIRNKLSSTLYRDYYSKGKMNEAVAYEFSKQSPETQQKIIDCFTSNGKKVEYIYSSDVEHYVDLANKFAALKCPVKKGEKCLNQSRLLDKCFDGGYTYKPCRHGNNTCCAKCDQYLHCKFRCPLMDEKAKAERSKQREASREQKAAEKAAKDAAIVNIERVWARFGMALNAAGLTEKQLRAQLKKKEESYNEFHTYLSTDKVAALLDYSCTETSQNDPLPFYHGFRVDDYRKLCAIADALGCSLDYLFLRSDEPKATQPVSDPDTAPEAATPTDWAVLTPFSARWHAGTKGLPVDRPILTWALTNAGEVYRTAIWTGERFVDTKNKQKELTGFSFTRWIEIPEDGSSFVSSVGWVSVEDDLPPAGKSVLVVDSDHIIDVDWISKYNNAWCCDGATHWMDLPPLPGEAAPVKVSDPDTAPGWKTGEPPRDGRYLCLVDMGLMALSEQRCEWRDGQWYAYGNPVDGVFAVKCWYPLPPEAVVREEEGDGSEAV